MNTDVAAVPETAARTAWRLVQRLLALSLLIALSPVLAVLWAAVRLGSRGPFLYGQLRPGLRGRPFRVWKIRTMQVGADRTAAHGLAVARDDPQVTRLGRVLRDLKIDELPQLWNVVRGEMEFVGPRPIAFVLHEKLRAELPGFERRVAVRPGLTNVAQVSILDNRPAAEVTADWALRLQADLHYLAHRTVAMDLVVIALTVVFVLRKALRRAARARSAPAAA